MTSRENLMEMVATMNEAAENVRESLWDEWLSHQQWLRDVFRTVDALTLKERRSIRGDLLPKTPHKRVGKRKATASTSPLIEQTEAPSKKAMTEIKRCQVKLFRVLSVSPSPGVEPEVASVTETSPLEPPVVLPQPPPPAAAADDDYRAEEPVDVASKPAKPPRKMRSYRNRSKENQSPVKNVVPKGMVAAHVQKYEEKIGLSPKKPLSQLTHVDPDLNVVPPVSSPKEVLEAKVVELRISRMSISRKRSSRMRRRLNSSKAILRRSSRHSVLMNESGSSRRSVAASSPSLSFATANNSPVVQENDVEAADVVNETVEDSVTQPSNDDVVASSGSEKVLEPASGARAEQNDEAEDDVDGSTDVVMATPPSLGRKSNVGGGDMTETRSLAACKVLMPGVPRTSPRPALSIITDSVKNKGRLLQRQNSFFGAKRHPSASPSGSTYRFGSTPDRATTPQFQNETLRHERKALLDARAESVLKKREEFLKRKVEEQKRKRELRLERVAKEKEKREMERVAKIEKQKEEERKKLLRRKQREDKRLAEARQMRLYEQRMEEQRLHEEREREEAERQAAERMREDLKRVRELASKVVKQAEVVEPKVVAEPVVEIKDIFVKPGAGKQCLNSTYNACGTPLNSTFNVDNYEITPKDRPVSLKNPENYDIDNLKEEDSTDEEDKPKKPIPSWASGDALRGSALAQSVKRPNFEKIFPRALMFVIPNLNAVFKTRRRRFNNRTSSAVWNRPPILDKSFNGV